MLRTVASCGRSIGLWSAIFLALLPALTYGQSSAPMSFSVFWPCMGTASFCAPRILAEGAIERQSHRNLVTFLSNAKARKNDFFPPKPDICFNSPGGDLAGAIELGRLIRKLGLNTCLASTYSRVIPGTGGDEEIFVKNALCASACSFAFVGGVNRFVEEKSRYGVHQFFGAQGNLGDSPTQVTVVVIAAYLNEMGISRTLLDVASIVPPKEMYWLTSQELREVGVDNMNTAMSKWKLDALNDGTVVATISQVKPGARSNLLLTILKSQGKPVLLIAFTPGDRSANSVKEAFQAVDGEPITLSVDKRTVGVYDAVRWRVVRDSVVVGLPLSPKIIESFRIGRTLRLEVPVAHAISEYDPSLDFPLERMGPLLSAALK